MGEKNDAILRYLEDNARFADLMNGAVFGGIQAIDPGQLEDASEHYTEKEGKGRSIHYRGRTRDIIRRVRNGGSILRLVALEAQETVDYGMPLRCMNYDAQEYSRQARALQKKNEKAEDYRKEKGEYNMYEEMGSFFMDGVEEGREEGREEGIRAMILDNLENGSSREQIQKKLERYFGMSEKGASEYLKHFLQEAECLSVI